MWLIEYLVASVNVLSSVDFVSVVALVDFDDSIEFGTQIVHGVFTFYSRGTGVFGYKY